MNTINVAKQELETLGGKIYDIVLPFNNGEPSHNDMIKADKLYHKYLKLSHLIKEYELKQSIRINVVANKHFIA